MVDWTGTGQVTSQLLAPRADSGRGVQDGGRAEGESQRSEAKMRWTSRAVAGDRCPVYRGNGTVGAALQEENGG